VQERRNREQRPDDSEPGRRHRATGLGTERMELGSGAADGMAADGEGDPDDDDWSFFLTEYKKEVTGHQPSSNETL
jgi:hypothetical protein